MPFRSETYRRPIDVLPCMPPKYNPNSRDCTSFPLTHEVRLYPAPLPLRVDRTDPRRLLDEAHGVGVIHRAEQYGDDGPTGENVAGRELVRLAHADELARSLVWATAPRADADVLRAPAPRRSATSSVPGGRRFAVRP
jgi:hypothetical protein